MLSEAKTDTYWNKLPGVFNYISNFPNRITYAT